MLQHICLFLFIFPVTEARVDDSQFSNITWKLEHSENGSCDKIKNHNKTQDKKNGRWYGMGSTHSEDDLKKSKCLHWDSYFDNKEIFHDFFYMEDQGKLRVLTETYKPISDIEGAYSDYVGYKWNDIYTTLYYVDEDFQIRYFMKCHDNGKISKLAILGFRDLKKVKKLKNQVKNILNDLITVVGKFPEPLRKIDHHDCQYQPEMKNPYKARVDDSPVTKITSCDNIKNLKTTRDRKLFEGRWYGGHISNSKVDLNKTKCLHWDSYFDTENHLHDFFYWKDQGKLRELKEKDTPISDGWVYSNGVGKNTYTALYYADEDFQVRFLMKCHSNGKISKLVKVGYRDLKKVTKLMNQVKKILNDLKHDVGEFPEPVQKFDQNDCQYQPEMKDPYKQ